MIRIVRRERKEGKIGKRGEWNRVRVSSIRYFFHTLIMILLFLVLFFLLFFPSFPFLLSFIFLSAAVFVAAPCLAHAPMRRPVRLPTREGKYHYHLLSANFIQCEDNPPIESLAWQPFFFSLESLIPNATLTLSHSLCLFPSSSFLPHLFFFAFLAIFSSSQQHPLFFSPSFFPLPHSRTRHHPVPSWLRRPNHSRVQCSAGFKPSTLLPAPHAATWPVGTWWLRSSPTTIPPCGSPPLMPALPSIAAWPTGSCCARCAQGGPEGKESGRERKKYGRAQLQERPFHCFPFFLSPLRPPPPPPLYLSLSLSLTHSLTHKHTHTLTLTRSPPLLSWNQFLEAQGLALPPDAVEGTLHGKPGAAEVLLEALYSLLTHKR